MLPSKMDYIDPGPAQSKQLYACDCNIVICTLEAQATLGSSRLAARRALAACGITHEGMLNTQNMA